MNDNKEIAMKTCNNCNVTFNDPEDENLMMETGEYYCDACWEHFQNGGK